MKAIIIAVPTILGDDKEVRLIIELGTRSHLAAQSPQQVAREITDVLARAEADAGNYIDAMRSAAHTERPASQLPSMTSTPSCTGCGSIVEKPGDLCVACAMKRTGLGPEASIALVNQGEPLYKREGAYRDAPTEREETT